MQQWSSASALRPLVVLGGFDPNSFFGQKLRCLSTPLIKTNRLKAPAKGYLQVTIVPYQHRAQHG